MFVIMFVSLLHKGLHKMQHVHVDYIQGYRKLKMNILVYLLVTITSLYNAHNFGLCAEIPRINSRHIRESCRILCTFALFRKMIPHVILQQ